MMSGIRFSLTDDHRTGVGPLLVTVLIVAGGTACGSKGTVMAGPQEISSTPREVVFLGPVPVSGPRRELCFDFDPPGESLKAPTLEAVLVTTTGRRDTLHQPQVDRRGEGRVCLIDTVPEPQGAEQLRGIQYRGVELRSTAPPVRVKAIWWWSGG